MIRELRKFVLAAFTILALVGTVGQAQSVMTHHVRDVVLNGTAQSTGRLSSNQVLQLDLVLPLSDPEGLQNFLKELYDPASPSYRQFLTPTEFTARFGPTQDQYNSVVQFATAQGFEVVGGSRDGMDVQVKGTVATIEAAFHLNMLTYKHPTENRDFYSPDTEPTLDLPFNLWHISGLDNYSIPQPLFINKNDYAAAHGIYPESVVSHATTGSGPSASFLGSDMRAAYYGGTALTGAGQNLGLLEYLGTDLADLNTYYSNVGQTNSVPITLLSTDGTSTSCVYSKGRCDDTEQTLDMTQALGMAPGLSSLVMYIGSSDTAILSAMTTHSPLPTTIGCSWGWTPVDPTTLDPYFEKMSAQGQNFFAASGDYSTWKSSGNSEPWPADDANVVSVGGTDLITASAGGAWSSETAWSDSGGGISPNHIAIPAWQQLSGVINSSNKGSTTLRNGPDVAANANFTFYTCADQKACNANLYGGTSFAAPMWAAYIALANEQRAEGSNGPIGFIDPTIYAENVGSGYSTDFHDITSGTSGSYSAVTGYDLVTGWGSPNGTGLINALAGTTQTSGFSVAASPASASITQGGASSSSTITVAPIGTFTSSVTLSYSALPSGVTASFGANPITGGSGSTALTFSASSTAATGTFAITVTGTSGSTNETATVNLTVSAAPTATFTLSANPTSLSISPGKSSSTTIASTPSGGFSSKISLSSSGQPSGVSVSFSSSSIADNGSTKMTVTASRTAKAGSYTITVTGTGGSITQHVSVPLTVP